MLSFIYTSQSHRKKVDSGVGAHNFTIPLCQTPFFRINCFYDQFITFCSVLVLLMHFENASVFSFSYFSYIEK